MSNVLLKATGLSKTFTLGEREITVLRDFDAEVHKGEMLGILGPSGAGKSTALHLLGLMEKPSTGQIVFEEKDLVSLSERAQAKFRNHRFGFVFQMFHLLPDLTALENVLLPVMINRTVFSWMGERGVLTDRAKELLGRMGLGERLHHRPSQLSGGERQRVAIARSLVLQPEIVFCDEPTGNLDTGTSAEIIGILEQINREEDVTFVVVTHSRDLAERMHRIIELVDGKITAVRQTAADSA